MNSGLPSERSAIRATSSSGSASPTSARTSSRRGRRRQRAAGRAASRLRTSPAPSRGATGATSRRRAVRPGASPAKARNASRSAPAQCTSSTIQRPSARRRARRAPRARRRSGSRGRRRRASPRGPEHGAHLLGDDARTRRRRRLQRAGDRREPASRRAGGQKQLRDRLERREHVRTKPRARDGGVRRAPASSSTSRVLPTPGGATTSSRRGLVAARSRSRRADARARPRGRAAARAARPSPRRATAPAASRERASREHGLRLPLQLERLRVARARRPPPTASAVVSPTSTSPGAAAACSRAATLTGSPVTIASSGAASGVCTTSPVLTPTRTASAPDSSPMRAASCSIARGEREPRAHRALRVVVARARDAEHRHRRVADELLEPAAVALDRLAHGVEVRGLHRRDVLRVKLSERDVKPTRSANRTVTILRSIDWRP